MASSEDFLIASAAYVFYMLEAQVNKIVQYLKAHGYRVNRWFNI